MDKSEVESLLFDYRSDMLDQRGQQRLALLLQGSEEVRRFAARWLQNESLLRGELVVEEVSRMFASEAMIPGGIEAGDFAELETSQLRSSRDKRPGSGWAMSVGTMTTIALALSLLLIVNVAVVRHVLDERDQSALLARSFPPAESDQIVHGQLVDTTVCVWSAIDGAPPLSGQRLVEGDSLQLLEGIASLSLEYGDTSAKLQVEGPAAVMLARGGIPNLRYGKVTLEVQGPSGKPFPLETSFGRVMTGCGSEIGIASFGSKGQVHVFAGDATVQSAWLTPQEGLVGPAEIPHLTVISGQSVALSNVGGNSLTSTPGRADRNYFTPSIPMRADFLAVTPEYIRAIEKSSPVAYWRFEGAHDGKVRNHMQDHFHASIHGEVDWIGPPGNQAVEFGMASTPGFLIVDDSWDETLQDDFSIELWMKPSHYHYGTMLGFVGEVDAETRRNSFGLALELGGTYFSTSYQRPRQIRCLFRTPLGMGGGPSVYSGESNEYLTRRWQHVVVVREGATLGLYLDGTRVNSIKFQGKAPQGLRLLLGQLYTDSVSRPFIGDLDEVAIYDRALEEGEIQSHYQLLRPSPAAVTQQQLLQLSGALASATQGGYAAALPGPSSLPSHAESRFALPAPPKLQALGL